MIRLISVFVLLSLLITGYVYATRSTEANIIILSPDQPCEFLLDDKEKYNTCLKIMEFSKTHDDVQIVID